VVEKLLTNWLSLCMYPYLKCHVNKSLFMLYKAIKHQTEKGPVDAVTGEARYSLSEDRLLREKTEARTLVCRFLLSRRIILGTVVERQWASVILVNYNYNYN